MRTPRFHFPAPLAEDAAVDLPRAVAHHARRVLRLADGDRIALFDGNGREFLAVLEGGGAADGARARVLEEVRQTREAALAITLVQALCAAEKIDFVVEKAVELGVVRIVLTPSERSVVRLGAERSARRLERWQDLVIAACAQCGRNRLPAVELAPSLESALAGVGAGERRLLDPGAEAGGVRSLRGPRIALAVGPEGGFSAEEAALARRLGYQGLRLGRRVLRTETAGLVAAAALLALHGEYD